METLLINNQIEREIVSKSCEMITTNKTNNRSPNSSELNINKRLN